MEIAAAMRSSCSSPPSATISRFASGAAAAVDPTTYAATVTPTPALSCGGGDDDDALFTSRPRLVSLPVQLKHRLELASSDDSSVLPTTSRRLAGDWLLESVSDEDAHWLARVDDRRKSNDEQEGLLPLALAAGSQAHGAIQATAVPPPPPPPPPPFVASAVTTGSGGGT
ncbi:hypothetical protein BIW11_09772, partial [Tropilaelaps mercedesae]